MAGSAGPDGASSVSTASVVTKGGPGSGPAALVAALTLSGLLAWLALSDGGRVGTQTDTDRPDEAGLDVRSSGSLVGEADPAALVSGPSPTVRWETPPKFGGHGDGYGIGPVEPLWVRIGPYR